MVLLITYETFLKLPISLELEKELKSSGTWWHHLDNTWIVETEQSPDQWQKKLAPYFAPNDHYLVVQIKKNYQGWLPKQAWDWLRERKF